MGCATSKQKVCRNCQTPYSPVRRSYSVHVHHPPQNEGDSYHLVALTSSTLGTLKLDPTNLKNNLKEEEPLNEKGDHDQLKTSKEEFTMSLIEAKTWSQMIDEKIPKLVPKTPIRTPPGEPETINAWELMEGLEDTSPLKPAHHLRSFSFHVAPNPIPSPFDHPTARVKENGEGSPRPLWMEMAESDSNSNSNATSIVSEFDPDVISTFRKALEELPPANPFHLKTLVSEKQLTLADQDQELDVANVKKVNEADAGCKMPFCKEKVVVYFTSLRGVRKTYEDCCYVRVILKGLSVKLDERDVSMDSGFREELKELLGEAYNGGRLPRVFVGKRYMGGAEEIRRMHEDGQLEKEVEFCERLDDVGGNGGASGVCEACGDIRFVPCETCSGSCKIYYEYDYEEEYDEDECGFQRCPACNENGLIRCPICCD